MSPSDAAPGCPASPARAWWPGPAAAPRPCRRAPGWREERRARPDDDPATWSSPIAAMARKHRRRVLLITRTRLTGGRDAAPIALPGQPRPTHGIGLLGA